MKEKRRAGHRLPDAQITPELMRILGTAGPLESEEEEIYRDMLFNVGLLRREKLDVQELRLVHKAFRELRHALRIFKAFRSVPKAAVFGSARTPRNHPDYKLAVEFARKLARKGWMIITGAASGIMEAAMVGAGARNSFGLNILLPFEQDPNEIIRGNEKLMYFKYFFTRKLMFLKESEATVLFPGGFGTFDEGFESFTLVQTGKAKPRPIVLVDSEGSSFWRSTLELLETNMERTALVSPGDLGLMRHYQDAEGAVREIETFYSNYHSSRFFKDHYLIRVRRKIETKTLRALGQEFADIVTEGRFEKMRNPADDDEKDPGLERILFRFDRSSFSRLRRLIDRLNQI